MVCLWGHSSIPKCQQWYASYCWHIWAHIFGCAVRWLYITTFCSPAKRRMLCALLILVLIFKKSKSGVKFFTIHSCRDGAEFFCLSRVFLYQKKVQVTHYQKIFLHFTPVSPFALWYQRCFFPRLLCLQLWCRPGNVAHATRSHRNDDVHCTVAHCELS